MIIQEADHPFILACEFEVCLPEAVAVLALESVFTPDLSRLGNWVVESSLVEDLVDGCVAYGCGVVVAKVSFDEA